jgi:hypothetical protein
MCLLLILLQASCELDPFCNDIDDPINAPLDTGAVLFLALILILLTVRQRLQKRASMSSRKNG